MGQRIERDFWDEKENLLAIENKAQELNERLFLYWEILTCEPQCFLLNLKENFIGEKFLILRDTKDIILSGRSMTVAKYSHDGKFEGNILIFRQTGCGKTTFIQNIAKNNLFSELKEIFWISKIPLSMEREKNISVCFSTTVRFKYPQTVDDFNMELAFFQRKGDDNVDIVMDENNVFNKIIVMDYVLAFADKSNDFANFLTVSRKFNFTCVYVFHALYPTRSN